MVTKPDQVQSGRQHIQSSISAETVTVKIWGEDFNFFRLRLKVKTCKSEPRARPEHQDLFNGPARPVNAAELFKTWK